MSELGLLGFKGLTGFWLFNLNSKKNNPQNPNNPINPSSDNQLMSKTPNYDAAVKKILDSLQPGERTCVLTGEKWTMTGEEISWYKKFNVPPSKYSPMTRLKIIGGCFIIFDMWYNQHAETGAPLVTPIHPASGIRVLPDQEWFTKDFIDKAREVEITKPFFEQLYTLTRDVPFSANSNYVQPTNSVAFISLGDQDSYFVIACQSKRAFFSANVTDLEDSSEVIISHNVKNSYFVVHSDRIYNCKFIRESFDCLDSNFLFDCRNCDHCFGATNQRNKKYIFFNEQLTRQQWEEQVAKINLSSFAVRKEYEARFYQLMQQTVWPENFNVNTENVTGEYLYDTSNIRDGYFVTRGCRDLDNIIYAMTPSHDCYSIEALFDSTDCYNGIGFNKCSLSKFALLVLVKCFDVEYCGLCYNCEHCFGCVGLRHKKFCILNKQYSEEEYWSKLDELKCAMLERGEYGQMPPVKFSTQHWSGCGARILFGAEKEECLRLGAVDFEPGAEGAEGPSVDPASIHSFEDFPDQIDDFSKIVGKSYKDEQFGRRFAYLKPELEFYKKFQIAPPRLHPTHRVQELYAEMNMPVLEKDFCKKCNKEITVAQNRKYKNRKIYCSVCYLKYLEENN